MLDILLFRQDKGGNPDLVRESQRRRCKDVGVVDKVIELDNEWRKLTGIANSDASSSKLVRARSCELGECVLQLFNENCVASVLQKPNFCVVYRSCLLS